MSTDHAHPEPVKCSHAEVSFCAKCDRPYCKACGKEWVAEPTYDLTKLWKERTPEPPPVPRWPNLDPFTTPKINWTAKITDKPETGTVLCGHDA